MNPNQFVADVERYQWIKGDHIGKVETVNMNDEGFIYFTSGNRIDINYLSEYLIPISNEADIIPINSPQSTLIPESKHVPAQTKTEVAAAPVEKVSPIQELLKRADKSSVPINIKIKVDLPKASVYKLLKESFGSADIELEIMKSVQKGLDVDNLYEMLQTEISKQVKSHYKPKRRRKNE